MQQTACQSELYLNISYYMVSLDVAAAKMAVAGAQPAILAGQQAAGCRLAREERRPPIETVEQPTVAGTLHALRKWDMLKPTVAVRSGS